MPEYEVFATAVNVPTTTSAEPHWVAVCAAPRQLGGLVRTEAPEPVSRIQPPPAGDPLTVVNPPIARSPPFTNDSDVTGASSTGANVSMSFPCASSFARYLRGLLP